MWNCAVHGPRTSTISAASGPRIYKNARSAVRRRPQSPRSPKQKRTQSRYPWCSSIPLNCDHRAKQPFCQVTSEGVCACVFVFLGVRVCVSVCWSPCRSVRQSLSWSVIQAVAPSFGRSGGWQAFNQYVVGEEALGASRAGSHLNHMINPQSTHNQPIVNT